MHPRQPEPNVVRVVNGHLPDALVTYARDVLDGRGGGARGEPANVGEAALVNGVRAIRKMSVQRGAPVALFNLQTHLAGYFIAIGAV